ncbi:cell wall protein IFF6-like [Patiria miniata]|uniref:Uncharacterized protein n=1 Tax=Patiria miniata TaxID=46514 RepID=A0A913ZK15_PATMI|nr:cell wall protein IFF6-like [Patiria miniata]
MAANTNEFADLLSGNGEENIWDEEVICRLQAYIRAFLIRKKFQEVRKLYEEIVSEVEGDISGKPSNVRWRTGLPCKPRYFQKPQKSSAVGKVGTQDARTHQTQHPPSDQQLVQDTDEDIKGQATSLDPGGRVTQRQVKGHNVTDGPNSTSDTSSKASLGDECKVNGASLRSEEVVKDQNGATHPISSRSLPSASHQEEVLPNDDGDPSSRPNKDPNHQVQPLQTRDDGSPGLDTDSDNIVNQAESLPKKDDVESPRLPKDPVSQDQGSANSEEGNGSNGFQNSSKQSDSVSENSGKNTQVGSPASSVEYTPDFESYSSTATSGAASLSSSAELALSKQDAGSVASPEFCIVTPLDDRPEESDSGLLQGTQNREAALERMDEREVEKKNGDQKSAEDFPASENDRPVVLSRNLQNMNGKNKNFAEDLAPVQSNRTDKVLPSNLQNMDRKSEDYDDKTVTSPTNEAKTVSHNGDDQTAKVSRDEASKSAEDFESSDDQENFEVTSQQSQDLKLDGRTDTPDAASKTSTNKENQFKTGSADRNAEMQTPSHVSRIVDHQRDGMESGIDAGKDEKETGGGLITSKGENPVAGRGILLGQERSGEQDFSGVADMTSIWSNEGSLTEMLESDYPTDLEALQKLRNSAALELLWVQQAISSRKNYLRLKSHMEPTGQQKVVPS